jgi:hypothetical protein
MPAFADGSGILLCPTGEGGSTISEAQYQIYVEDYGDAIVEIGPSEFAQWLSNAKKISYESSLAEFFDGEPSGDPLEETYEYRQYFRGIQFDGSDSYYNDSDHPFPMNFYSAQSMGFIANEDFFYGPMAPTPIIPFDYRISGSEGVRPPSSHVFTMFIRDDKFYMIVPYYFYSFDDPDSIQRSLSVTASKITIEETQVIPVSGDINATSVYSASYEITDRFY